MLHRATVTSTSPLRVRMHGDPSTVNLPATRASWSSYTPSVGHGVLVDYVADNHQVIIMGRDS